MIITWFRNLLIFDGFLAQEGAVTNALNEPDTDRRSWLHQLLVLDGFVKTEPKGIPVPQVAIEIKHSQAPVLASIVSAAPESAIEDDLSENFFSEILTTPDKPEISPQSEEAVTDWQRILGWKE
jgi:hypothetical protein